MNSIQNNKGAQGKMDIRKAAEQKNFEEIERELLDLDDTFRFKCRHCGKCCKDQQEVIFTACDLFHVARKKEISTGRAIQEYGETYIGPNSLVPLVRMLPKNGNGDCPLLTEDGRCSVHDCKPTVCALYPLGRVILNAEVGGPLRERAKLRVKYVLNDYQCGSAKRVNTVCDWLARFSIPERDSFFLEWNRLLLPVSKAAYSLQESEKRAELNALWDKAFFHFCLNYDTDADFMPQFKENRKAVEEYLRLTMS